MAAINTQTSKKSRKNSTFIVSGILALAGGLLFAYLMLYTAPEENFEIVKVVAITSEG